MQESTSFPITSDQSHPSKSNVLKFQQNYHTPIFVNQNLYQRYSSSQSYFYSKTITDIIKQKRSKVNLQYDDIECFCDDQENFKRFYNQNEHSRKMSAFKQYYFYHEDCPRIFTQKIQQIYERWHQKKRDLVYKKLKIMYGEDYDTNSNSDTNSQLKDQQEHAITHFLLNVSEYNPYSKKYYLRVQGRQQKQKQTKQQMDHKKTKDHIEDLNHELSMMLQNINNISMISTLGNNEQQNNNILRTNVQRYSQESSPRQPKKSQSKLNFKKKSLEPVVVFSNTKVKKEDQFISLKSKQLINSKNNLNQRNDNSNIHNSNRVIKHQKNISSTNQQQSTKLQSIPQRTKRKSTIKNIPIETPLVPPQYPLNSSPRLQQNIARTKSIFSISSFNSKNILPQNSIPLNSNQKLYPSFSVRLKNQQKNNVSSKVPKIKIKQGLETNKRNQSQKMLRRSDNIQHAPINIINRPEYRSISMKKIDQYQPQHIQQFSDRKLAGTGSTNFKSYRSQQSQHQYRVKLNVNSKNHKDPKSQKKVFKRSNNNYF